MQMEDLPKRAVQHVFMAFDSTHGSKTDITVRPHWHRTLSSDFPLLGPRAPCIDIVAFKYAEANGDQVDAIAFCKFVGRIDPGLTVFSGDQNKLAAVDQSVECDARALPFHPCVRKRMA